MGGAAVSHGSCSYAYQVIKPSSVGWSFSDLSEGGWHSEPSVALTMKPQCGVGCELHSELAATGYTHGPFPSKDGWDALVTHCMLCLL